MPPYRHDKYHFFPAPVVIVVAPVPSFRITTSCCVPLAVEE